MYPRSWSERVSWRRTCCPTPRTRRDPKSGLSYTTTTNNNSDNNIIDDCNYTYDYNYNDIRDPKDSGGSEGVSSLV